MERDMGWKGYFSDDERHADVINGIACNGRQVVRKSELQEMLDFADIPECLQKMTLGYRINLIEICKIEDTSVFRTDVRQELIDEVRREWNR